MLDGYGPDEVATGAYGQSLIPWPNRLADGAYDFEGSHHQVPLTEPDKHNAIHGFARWMEWRVAEREPERAVLTLRIYPRAGYPFALDLAIEYTVNPGGVTVRTTARNSGRSALPYANGFHPYLTLGAKTIDTCRLLIPARTWMPTDEQGIPTGRSSVKGSEYDFRTGRGIGSTVLDTGYADLIRGEDGLARVELEAPDGGRKVSVWLDQSYPYVMAFSGDSLPDAGRRRRALGVEPMTGAPNASAAATGCVCCGRARVGPQPGGSRFRDRGGGPGSRPPSPRADGDGRHASARRSRGHAQGVSPCRPRSMTAPMAMKAA